VDVSEGLVPGKQREENVYLSVGIVSTEGDEENLLQALRSLITHTSPTEYPQVVMVVAVEGGLNAAILQRIKENFQNELDGGLIQVLHPTTEFLREVNAEPVGWESVPSKDDFMKKVEDLNKRLIFLFEYCFRISKNFLLLTDQARAIRRYIPVIKQEVNNFERQNLSSYAHDFGANALAGLGRLYSRKLTGDLAEIGSMFPDGHPPSKIVETYETLRASVKVANQLRENFLFNMVKELRGVKPQVAFETSCAFEVGHGLGKAFYDKEGFAWLKVPKTDERLVMVFKEPIWISRVRIATGSPLYRDPLSDSVLLACENNDETRSCDDSQCTKIGVFGNPVLDAQLPENVLVFPVKCLKIVFTADIKHWVIIREISIWPKN